MPYQKQNILFNFHAWDKLSSNTLNLAKMGEEKLTFHCVCEQEQLEKKKAEYGEKLKNKIATIHREAEEKRAFIEAQKGEEFLKAEETAAKYRATGTAPTKLFGCF